MRSRTDSWIYEGRKKKKKKEKNKKEKRAKKTSGDSENASNSTPQPPPALMQRDQPRLELVFPEFLFWLHHPRHFTTLGHVSYPEKRSTVSFPIDSSELQTKVKREGEKKKKKKK
jgi:hypothetical protein